MPILAFERVCGARSGPSTRFGQIELLKSCPPSTVNPKHYSKRTRPTLTRIPQPMTPRGRDQGSPTACLQRPLVRPSKKVLQPRRNGWRRRTTISPLALNLPSPRLQTANQPVRQLIVLQQQRPRPAFGLSRLAHLFHLYPLLRCGRQSNLADRS